MKTVGLVGWRGMVGSVLMQRMSEEGDFAHFTPHFFSTSQAGEVGPNFGGTAAPLQDAHDIDALAALDIIVTCQGGEYTQQVHGALRARGWTGYWIDAASTLRMKEHALIILDPVNRPVIEQGLAAGGARVSVGGNVYR
ncbi:aspartate-semialdehyde dehydrogenase [mine drainage metagenome]|uniref:Aspartate-semialdehyde dehydrogenase n=1 Tax=mine drainage metagenome TaxID=410659 RepID=T1C7T6_9ZZZZ